VDLRITFSNYRCFSRAAPVRIVLRPGTIAIVGANNAGKSAVLRFFWEFRGLFESLSGHTGNFIHAVAGQQQQFPWPTPDPHQMFCDADEGDLRIEVELLDVAQSFPPIVDRVVVTIPRPTSTYLLELYAGVVALPIPTNWDGPFPKAADNAIIADLQLAHDAFRLLSRALFIGASRSALPSASGNDFDAEIGNLLIQRWGRLKSGPLKADRQLASRATARLREIFGLREFDIDVNQSQSSLIATVDGETYGFDELGTGLGHFAVTLANLAGRPQPSWILVDEPENGLHPTLRLEFIATLEAFASEGVVFATHSYGLARRAADRIYVVRRDQGTRRSAVHDHDAVPSLVEFLGELGFSGYRDLGFDQILLVEGSTDVRTIDAMRRVMRLRGNVILLPLGGSDQIKPGAEVHLAQLKQITDRIAALIDSERTCPNGDLPPDRVAFQEACDALGIRCHVLERRATENYLTDRAVRAVLGASHRGLGPFERLADVTPRWSKGQNARIAGAMEASELQGTDLGAFLTECLSTA
jgi:ABC-type transport system involved in cytochrome c biogenesis ATPase subunit